jgi:signal transduction histidine kinase
MPRDIRKLARVLPQLRRDFETSRRLVTRAVERAARLADEAVATRRLIETRPQQRSDGHDIHVEVCNATAHELLRVSRERDRELGIVAHELRQSLAAALTADQLIAVSSNSETIARARGVLSRQLLHLSELVDTLLDYSRLSLQTASVATGSVDVVEVAGAAIEAVAPSAAERHQDMRLLHLGGKRIVRGDQSRLRQALVNLLQNAVRYTPESGRIDVAIHQRDGIVRVEVRDTGEGIDPERLKAIFDPFVRLSATGPGLGIGLTLVRRIVELHGGSISAASDGRGRGSVFTLSLPAAGPTDVRP